MTQHDTECTYDWQRSRWLCPDASLAHQAGLDHPGDYIYTYDRDSEGRMVNIIAYWTPKDPDDARRPSAIRNGKISWTK